MTLDEVRKVLGGAAWIRETPLVTLLDEIVERHDAPFRSKAGSELSGAITRAFDDHRHSQVSSGRVVQLLISLRQRHKMPLYALQT